MMIKLANEAWDSEVLDYFRANPEEAQHLPAVIFNDTLYMIDGSHRFTALAELGIEIKINLYEMGSEYEEFLGCFRSVTTIDEEFIEGLSGAEYSDDEVKVVFI